MRGIEYYTFRSNGLAKRFRDTKLTKDVLSIRDIMGLALTSVNSGNMTKAQRDTLSRGGVCYSFTFKTPINNGITKVILNIPSHLIEEYKKEIKQLNALTEVSQKVIRANFIKLSALAAASLVLVSFATIKFCDSAVKAYTNEEQYQEQKMEDYFALINSSDNQSKAEMTRKEEEYVAELLKRAQSGDSAAKEEYNEYVMKQVADDVLTEQNSNFKR